MSGQPSKLNWTDIVQRRATPDGIVGAIDVKTMTELNSTPAHAALVAIDVAKHSTRYLSRLLGINGVAGSPS
jgi:hypothetical protein